MNLSSEFDIQLKSPTTPGKFVDDSRNSTPTSPIAALRLKTPRMQHATSPTLSTLIDRALSFSGTSNQTTPQQPHQQNFLHQSMNQNNFPSSNVCQQHYLAIIQTDVDFYYKLIREHRNEELQHILDRSADHVHLLPFNMAGNPFTIDYYRDIISLHYKVVAMRFCIKKIIRNTPSQQDQQPSANYPSEEMFSSSTTPHHHHQHYIQSLHNIDTLLDSLVLFDSPHLLHIVSENARRIFHCISSAHPLVIMCNTTNYPPTTNDAQLPTDIDAFPLNNHNILLFTQLTNSIIRFCKKMQYIQLTYYSHNDTSIIHSYTHRPFYDVDTDTYHPIDYQESPSDGSNTSFQINANGAHGKHSSSFLKQHIIKKLQRSAIKQPYAHELSLSLVCINSNNLGALFNILDRLQRHYGSLCQSPLLYDLIECGEFNLHDQVLEKYNFFNLKQMIPTNRSKLTIFYPLFNKFLTIESNSIPNDPAYAYNNHLLCTICWYLNNSSFDNIVTMRVHYSNPHDPYFVYHAGDDGRTGRSLARSIRSTKSITFANNKQLIQNNNQNTAPSRPPKTFSNLNKSLAYMFGYDLVHTRTSGTNTHPINHWFLKFCTTNRFSVQYHWFISLLQQPIATIDTVMDFLQTYHAFKGISLINLNRLKQYCDLDRYYSHSLFNTTGSYYDYYTYHNIKKSISLGSGWRSKKTDATQFSNWLLYSSFLCNNETEYDNSCDDEIINHPWDIKLTNTLHHSPPQKKYNEDLVLNNEVLNNNLLEFPSLLDIFVLTIHEPSICILVNCLYFIDKYGGIDFSAFVDFETLEKVFISGELDPKKTSSYFETMMSHKKKDYHSNQLQNLYTQDQSDITALYSTYQLSLQMILTVLFNATRYVLSNTNLDTDGVSIDITPPIKPVPSGSVIYNTTQQHSSPQCSEEEYKLVRTLFLSIFKKLSPSIQQDIIDWHRKYSDSITPPAIPSPNHIPIFSHNSSSFSHTIMTWILSDHSNHQCSIQTQNSRDIPRSITDIISQYHCYTPAGSLVSDSQSLLTPSQLPFHHLIRSPLSKFFLIQFSTLSSLHHVFYYPKLFSYGLSIERMVRDYVIFSCISYLASQQTQLILKQNYPHLDHIVNKFGENSPILININPTSFFTEDRGPFTLNCLTPPLNAHIRTHIMSYAPYCNISDVLVEIYCFFLKHCFSRLTTFDMNTTITLYDFSSIILPNIYNMLYISPDFIPISSPHIRYFPYSHQYPRVSGWATLLSNPLLFTPIFNKIILQYEKINTRPLNQIIDEERADIRTYRIYRCNYVLHRIQQRVKAQERFQAMQNDIKMKSEQQSAQSFEFASDGQLYDDIGVSYSYAHDIDLNLFEDDLVAEAYDDYYSNWIPYRTHLASPPTSFANGGDLLEFYSKSLHAQIFLNAYNQAFFIPNNSSHNRTSIISLAPSTILSELDVHHFLLLSLPYHPITIFILLCANVNGVLSRSPPTIDSTCNQPRKYTSLPQHYMQYDLMRACAHHIIDLVYSKDGKMNGVSPQLHDWLNFPHGLNGECLKNDIYHIKHFYHLNYPLHNNELSDSSPSVSLASFILLFFPPIPPHINALNNSSRLQKLLREDVVINKNPVGGKYYADFGFTLLHPALMVLKLYTPSPNYALSMILDQMASDCSMNDTIKLNIAQQQHNQPYALLFIILILYYLKTCGNFEILLSMSSSLAKTLTSCRSPPSSPQSSINVVINPHDAKLFLSKYDTSSQKVQFDEYFAEHYNIIVIDHRDPKSTKQHRTDIANDFINNIVHILPDGSLHFSLFLVELLLDKWLDFSSPPYFHFTYPSIHQPNQKLSMFDFYCSFISPQLRIYFDNVNHLFNNSYHSPQESISD